MRSEAWGPSRPGGLDTSHLEPFAERLETAVERRRILPERRMGDIGHHLHLRMGHARAVLIGDGRLDDNVSCAVHDENGLAYFRQNVVIVERP